MIAGRDVVAEARRWVGVPFAHQHRHREVGVDCVGLVVCVARALAVVPAAFDVTGYPAVPDGRSMRAQCDAVLEPAAALQLGGVALLAWMGGPPQHLGIVAEHPSGGWSLIHAENRRHRQVIEQRLVVGRAMQLVAAYRLPGVA